MWHLCLCVVVVLSVVTLRVREHSRIQIMVMDPLHLIHLPVVWVRANCVECVARVIVIINTYSICDSECRRVGSMVSELRDAVWKRDNEKTRINQVWKTGWSFLTKRRRLSTFSWLETPISIPSSITIHATHTPECRLTSSESWRWMNCVGQNCVWQIWAFDATNWSCWRALL